jgi:gamma-glutamylcyclotransferase (GGCT)/AIG2-like uncharacterized protein YtfP
MSELIFFYGTLMAPFNGSARRRMERHLEFKGPGTIEGALFDLGIYPAAVPALGGRVHGELYEMLHPTIVLRELDELEGYNPGAREKSLYTRARTTVTLQDGATAYAWTYFYNAPLGRAERIESGDYLEHLGAR